MEMTPSPVRRMFSSASECAGYHTCYPSDSTGIEPDFPAGRLHTARNPKLAHGAEREFLSQRAAKTRVARHIEFGATGAAAMGEVGWVKRMGDGRLRDRQHRYQRT